MTTYILGAGASVHAGYPLNKDLWPRLVAFAHSEIAHQTIRDALETIHGLYGPVLDIETVLTALDRGDGAFQSLTGDERVRVIRGIRAAVADLFARIHSESRPRTDYDRLSNVISAGDVVVTFNYDMALDAALAQTNRFSAPHGYCFPGIDESPSHVKLLKPHGSVNWSGWDFAGSTETCALTFQTIGDKPLVDNCNGSLPNHSKEILSPEFTGGRVARSIGLILLTRAKRFSVTTTIGEEWGPFYEHLWNKVMTALAQSERIVVIGYSLPNADKHARGAIPHHANKDARIEILRNGLDRIADDFLEHGFLRVQVGSKFEQFLNSAEVLQALSRGANHN